jgi:hypothetical protein
MMMMMMMIIIIIIIIIATITTDHSLSSCAEVKNAWSYTSTSPICLQSVVLN